MNIQGKLIEKFDTQVVSDKFRKREFVIEFSENPQYPEYIKFELIQDKTTLLDPFNIGDQVDVSFNLKGRTWTNPQGVKQYFNSLQAWRLNGVSGASSAPQAQQYQQAPVVPSFNTVATEGDDLPF
jgi:hypothetical protein